MGGGINTAALALMLEFGQLGPEYPAPDLAVFADTQAEPPHVYETLDLLDGLVSFPILRPTLGDLEADTWAMIRGEVVPHRGQHYHSNFTDLPTYVSGGGMAKRQCTSAYKIDVIRRAVRAWAGVNPPALQVRQYLGIAADEAQRIRENDRAYITNDYPLAYSGIKRADCIAYLAGVFPDGRPVGRSACFFCPFHGRDEWENLRARYPELYARALAMEEGMAVMGRGPFYLAKGGLARMMAISDQQPELFPRDQWGAECAGVCGV